jgi:hypothetical protein
MIHHPIGATRKLVRVIAAVSGPLLTVSLSNLASAGGAVAPDSQPTLRGSYCEGSDQDLAPGRAGCARIKGYIAAGERFGSDDRIGGRLSPFGPLDESGIAGARSSSGLVVIGAPLSGDRFLAPTSKGDIAR